MSDRLTHVITSRSKAATRSAKRNGRSSGRVRRNADGIELEDLRDVHSVVLDLVERLIL